MGTVQEKERALRLLNDFEMLKSGEWEPDDYSIDASIAVIDEIIQFIEQNNFCQCQTEN